MTETRRLSEINQRRTEAYSLIGYEDGIHSDFSLLERQETAIRVPTFQNRKIEHIIDLKEYVRRVKFLELDEWQIDFCDKLQNAFFTRNIKAMKACIAVMPQAGKSVLISQAFPAWILGHDPYHRIVLACYNLTRSQKHSRVVVGLMRSAEHVEIFPDPECRLPLTTSTRGWSTLGRLNTNFEGQDSFTSASLLTGLTGVGFDTLIVDDPYPGAKEANSEKIRESVWTFYEETAQMRGSGEGNIFMMFHRYHQDDIGGKLLATKEFEYWFYAAEYYGDFVDDETGLSYPDAYPREMGEYLSPRRSHAFYLAQKAKPKLWASQFQQKPTGDFGNMFNVAKITKVPRPRDDEFVFIRRDWDHAVSKLEGSAFTVGLKQGMRADGSVVILDIIRLRIDSGERFLLQRTTAEKDGSHVIITIPQDPGSAGQDTVFTVKNYLKGYIVESVPTAKGKTERAEPASIAVNLGHVSIVDDSDLPEDQKWNKTFLNELKGFPNATTYKDQVDAFGDGYSRNKEDLERGLVVKTYSPKRNILSWSQYANRFGRKIPHHWEIYSAMAYSPDESKPSGAVLCARAAENAFIGEAVFVIASFRQNKGSFKGILEWLDQAIKFFIAEKTDANNTIVQKPIPLIWLDAAASEEVRTAVIKLKMKLRVFDGEPDTGVSEMNWYFDRNGQQNPCDPNKPGTHLYLLSADNQIETVSMENELGQRSMRQELETWSYNSKSLPTEFGGVLGNCLRMILCDFKPRAVELTTYEQAEQQIREMSPTLTNEAIMELEDAAERQHRLLHRGRVLNKKITELETKKRVQSDFLDWMEQGDE